MPTWIYNCVQQKQALIQAPVLSCSGWHVNVVVFQSVAASAFVGSFVNARGGEVSKKFHSNECRRINYYQQMCLYRTKHPTAFALLRSFSFSFYLFFFVEEGRCWSLILTQRFIKIMTWVCPSPCRATSSVLHSVPPSTLHCKCHRSTGTSGGKRGCWHILHIEKCLCGRCYTLRRLLFKKTHTPHPTVTATPEWDVTKKWSLLVTGWRWKHIESTSGGSTKSASWCASKNK